MGLGTRLCIEQQQQKEKAYTNSKCNVHTVVILLSCVIKSVSFKLIRYLVPTSIPYPTQIRWHKTLTSLQSRHTSLVGDTLLSTACLVYAGPFSPSLRQPLMGKWRHLCQEARLPPNQGFSMETSLVESDQVSLLSKVLISPLANEGLRTRVQL